MDSINFQLIGNWAGVKASLEDLPENIKKSAYRGQRTAGEAFAKLVKGHILNNDLGLAPKVRDNHDSRPLIDTRAYVSSISSFSSGGIYYVGVKPSLYEPVSKIPIHVLAIILEVGVYGVIPPRPAWELSYEEYMKNGGPLMYVHRAIFKYFKDELNPLGFENF